MIDINDLVESARRLAADGSAEVRLFPGGLFVAESALRRELPAEIAKLAGQDSKIEALRLQILKAVDWKLVYWVEGGMCQAGLAVILEEGSEFPSNLRLAANFLHDRDPYFLEKKDWTRILLHVDWAAEVRIYDQWFKIPHTVIEEFARLYGELQAARPLRRSHENIVGSSSRDRLRVLLKMLIKSEPVKVTHQAFVKQMRYRGILSYRKYRDVIFCLSREAVEGIILDYEVSSELRSEANHSLDPKTVFDVVRMMLGRRQVQKTVRLNRKGIFIAQKAVKKFSHNYAHTDPAATVGSIKKKLKRITGGEIVYLIDGDRSQFGILLPMHEVVGAFGWCHNDDIVFGKSMILHDDPLYSSGQGIGLPMRSKCLARFQLGDRLCHISIHAFMRFLERATPKAAEFKRAGAYDVVNRRGYLMLMYDLLRKSEPIRRLNGAIQFLKHELVDASYRASEGWIWVILPDDTLITCYYRRNPFKSVFRRQTETR